MRHNKDAIERALTVHVAGGHLRAWKMTDDGTRYLVRLTSGETIRATLTEVHFLVMGLASAVQATV